MILTLPGEIILFPFSGALPTPLAIMPSDESEGASVVSFGPPDCSPPLFLTDSAVFVALVSTGPLPVRLVSESLDGSIVFVTSAPDLGEATHPSSLVKLQSFVEFAEVTISAVLGRLSSGTGVGKFSGAPESLVFSVGIPDLVVSGTGLDNSPGVSQTLPFLLTSGTEYGKSLGDLETFSEGVAELFSSGTGWGNDPSSGGPPELLSVLSSLLSGCSGNHGGSMLPAVLGVLLEIKTSKNV